MPKIGYGSNHLTRHMTPSGHKVLLVHNAREVDLLLMHAGRYAAEVAHAVSSRKRIEILARAKVLGVKYVLLPSPTPIRCPPFQTSLVRSC